MLMVGTIEPRKSHEQALDAFEILWKQNVPLNLVIVGQQGWKVDSLVERIKKHDQLGKRLFWLARADDDVLSTIYQGAAGLLAASLGEGFGLPLIEAARYQLPIVARDIPVFREVAGEHAYYFRGNTPESLAEAVSAWLKLRETGGAPSSKGIPWLTWEQSAQQLLHSVMSNASYRKWDPGKLPARAI
jgi:glycosyltransferase involved in cell wall biosynthesis